MAAKVAQGVGFFLLLFKAIPVTAVPVRTACVCYVSSAHNHNLNQLPIDRDSSRFRMGPKTIQRRRHLFWELFAVDSWSVSSSLFTLEAMADF